MWVLIFLTVGGHFASCDPVPSRPTVNTTYGPVQGLEEGGVLQFFDIPYGNFSENPLQEPTKPANWEDPINKNKHESQCPQMKDGSYSGDHNCLTLSIFKAANETAPQNVKNELAAVLFHIHDSSFSTGSGDPLVYGPKYLVENDIILVLPNYRLGVLGFLCLQNMSAPGNAALKDLTLALDWTKENIRVFGGDPNNIVVSGAGSGGALAELLLISNVSRPYISRAITESGFSLSPWAIDRNPLATASSLPQLPEKITKIKQLVTTTSNIEFRPCIEIESGFITESPWILLRRNQTGTKLAYMTGTANHAAWGEAVRQTATEDSLSELNKNPTLLLPNDLIFENDEEKSRIGRQVRSFYFGGREITRTDVNQLSQLFTDTGYLNSGLRGARFLVEAGVDVYFYEYSFNNPDLKTAFDASTRGDSLAFVFSRSGETTTNVAQTAIRRIMTSLWANFIKNGKPPADIEWGQMKDVAPAEEEWLSIGASVEMLKGLHVNRLRLWQDIYDKHFIYNSPGFVHKPSIYILVSGLSILTRLGVFRG